MVRSRYRVEATRIPREIRCARGIRHSDFGGLSVSRQVARYQPRNLVRGLAACGQHNRGPALHPATFSMGWTDSHLIRFVIHGNEYGMSHPGGPMFPRYASKVRLVEFDFRISKRFLYEHDFGDHWQHDIRLERQAAVDPRKTYPLRLSPGSLWRTVRLPAVG